MYRIVTKEQTISTKVTAPGAETVYRSYIVNRASEEMQTLKLRGALAWFVEGADTVAELRRRQAEFNAAIDVALQGVEDGDPPVVTPPVPLVNVTATHVRGYQPLMRMQEALERIEGVTSAYVGAYTSQGARFQLATHLPAGLLFKAVREALSSVNPDTKVSFE